MRRTQIYLTEEEHALLGRLARARRVTKAHLIRDAIERVYGQARDADTVISILEGCAGSWQRRESGRAYVERLRNGRLARVHGAR